MSLETVFNWTFPRDPWTLDIDSWIQSGVLPRLMANNCGCAICGVPCCGVRVGCSLCDGVLVRLGCFAVALALEEIGCQEVLQTAAAAGAAADSDHDARVFLATSEARAFEGLHCVVALQAAANFYLIALPCLVTSAAQALEYVSWVHSLQAAASSAAALFEGSSCKHFLEHTFDSCWKKSGIILLVLWKCSEVNSSMIGTGKTQKCE